MECRSALLFLVFLCLCGCQNSRNEGLLSDLAKSRDGLEQAHRRIAALEARSSDLEEKLAQAESAYDNLLVQQKETDRWIARVVKQIGPCVWFGGSFERPLPVKPSPDETPQGLISELNSRFAAVGSPAATLLSVEEATAFVRIDESRKLTQQMGSSGAASYLKAIVFTLFSVEPIQCVDLDFEEGDHAAPGTRCLGQGS